MATLRLTNQLTLHGEATSCHILRLLPLLFLTTPVFVRCNLTLKQPGFQRHHDVNPGMFSFFLQYSVTAHNATNTLDSFCSWQSIFNGKDTRDGVTPTAHHDVAVLFTKSVPVPVPGFSH